MPHHFKATHVVTAKESRFGDTYYLVEACDIDFALEGGKLQIGTRVYKVTDSSRWSDSLMMYSGIRVRGSDTERATVSFALEDRPIEVREGAALILKKVPRWRIIVSDGYNNKAYLVDSADAH